VLQGLQVFQPKMQLTRGGQAKVWLCLRQVGKEVLLTTATAGASRVGEILICERMRGTWRLVALLIKLILIHKQPAALAPSRGDHEKIESGKSKVESRK
jgi:hypothetical protein